MNQPVTQDKDERRPMPTNVKVEYVNCTVGFSWRKIFSWRKNKEIIKPEKKEKQKKDEQKKDLLDDF